MADGLHGDQLTALNVQGCTALKGLWCCSNRLTALNVQGCTALKSLGCYGNRLNADAFKKLFDDLPQRDAGDNEWCTLYTEEPGVTEGNYTDFTTPSEVQAAFQNAKDVKKWKMFTAGYEPLACRYTNGSYRSDQGCPPERAGTRH